MEINEIIKSLFKEKTIAYLHRYQEGALHYQFQIGTDQYEFAISTIEINNYVEELFGQFIKRTEIELAEDVGNTPFTISMKASELTRWIKKSELIKLTE